MLKEPKMNDNLNSTCFFADVVYPITEDEISEFVNPRKAYSPNEVAQI